MQFNRVLATTIVASLSCLAWSQAPVKQDTFVQSGRTTSSTPQGTMKTLLVDSATGARSFVQFDLTRLPATAISANVSRATVRLYVASVTTPGAFDVLLVNSSWSEATATYNQPPSVGPTALSAIPVGMSTDGNYVLLDVTAVVKLWLAGAANGGIENNGIALAPSPGSSISVAFDSKEASSTSHDPELEIDYIDSAVTNGLSSLQSQISQERLDRQNADASTLAQAGGYTNQQMAAEADTRAAADAAITGIVNAEAAARTAADAAIHTALDPLVANVRFPVGFDFVNPHPVPTNTAVGDAALATNGSGYSNTAVGKSAMGSNTRGIENTAVGHIALNLNVSGGDNTGIGYAALGTNNSDRNTAVGSTAMLSNASGGSNSALGYSSMYSNSSGANNVAVGAGALTSNTVGNQNVAVGRLSLLSNVDGSDNVALGDLAGRTLRSGSHNVFIASDSASDSESATIRIGTPGTHTRAFFAGISGNQLIDAQLVAIDSNGQLGTTAPNLISGSLQWQIDSSVAAINAETAARQVADAALQSQIAATPQLTAPNTFTANQTIVGNLALSGAGHGIAFADGTTQTTAASQSAIPTPTASPAANPLKVALLKWYSTNQIARYVICQSPFGLAFDGASMWVACPGGVFGVRAVDGKLGAGSNAGVRNVGVAFDGSHIWVTDRDSNSVRKLETDFGSVVGTYSTGAGPTWIAFDGLRIWVSNENGNTLTVLRASDGGLLATYASFHKPEGLAVEGDNIWVTNAENGTVSKVRTSDGTILGTYAVGNSPYGIAFDGANMWISNLGSNTVTKLRALDGAVQGTFAVGTNPYGVVFDGTNIWVANVNSGTVTVLRASDGSLVNTVVVGGRPQNMAFDGANVWVGDAAGMTVIKM